MTSYLAGRALSLTLTLLVASAVVFTITNVLPGDPAAFMMGLNADPEATAALRTALGLDAPVLVRYGRWVLGLLSGDLGVSYTYAVPVAELVGERLWVSLPLAIFSLALATALAIPLGLLAAARRDRAADTLIVAATQVGLAVPNFWFALLLVLLFATTLGWFQAGGFPGWDQGAGRAFQALVLPAVALALPQAAVLTRVTRQALIETLEEDYMRTARAKGLSRGQALVRHGLRNALIPVLTLMGLQFSFLLAGGIIIENVFYLPGLGRLVFQAILQRDLIVVQSVVMLLVFAVVLVAFLVDVLYVVVDPRLRRRAAP